MTKTIIKSESKRKNVADFVNLAFSMSVFLLALTLVTRLSPFVSSYVREGLSLCYMTIIPSVFPFMILSDAVFSFVHFEKIKACRKVFSSLFKINGYALSAFVCGALCGFPIGAKMAKDLYSANRINKDECERLIALSNNASPAFVISGIGAGLFKNVKYGIILYVISILSAIISCIVFSVNKPVQKDNYADFPTDFSLSESVKKAAYNTLVICGFITFFSVILGILTSLIKNEIVISLLSVFLEVGNAVKHVSSSLFFSFTESFVLSAFAISFSGISVHLQTKSLLTDTDISMKKYYISKLFSGIIAAIFAVIISYII